MWENYICARPEDIIVEDDYFVESVDKQESLAEHPKKTFLRHLVNEVQAAGTVDVAFAVE